MSSSISSKSTLSINPHDHFFQLSSNQNITHSPSVPFKISPITNYGTMPLQCPFTNLPMHKYHLVLTVGKKAQAPRSLLSVPSSCAVNKPPQLFCSKHLMIIILWYLYNLCKYSAEGTDLILILFG